MRVSKKIRFGLVAFVLLIGAERLPAPISEVPTATPVPKERIKKASPNSEKLFAGTWEGTVRQSSPGGTFRFNSNPQPANLVINENETRCTLTYEKATAPNRVHNFSLRRTAPNRLMLHGGTYGLADNTTVTVQGDTMTLAADDRPELDFVLQGSFHRKK